jgi:TonB family protein
MRFKPIQIALFLAALIGAPSLATAQDNLSRARPHYEQGRRLYRSGHQELAIEELYTAVSIEEVYFDAQLLLSRVLLTAQRPREAHATLRAIERRRRDTAQVQKLLGYAYFQMNRLDAAEEILKYAISLAARPDPELHYHLGLVRLRQGDTQSAIREAKRVLVNAPHFTPARKLLSDAYLVANDPQQAALELTRCLRLARGRTERDELRERLLAIRSLAWAKPEQSVKAWVVRPQMYSIPRPSYTPEARRNRIEGTVSLKVLFGSDGTVQRAIVTQGLGFGLDEQAAAAARGIEFTPGSLNGKSISVWTEVKVRFSLADDRRKKAEEEEKIAIVSAGPVEARTGLLAPSGMAPRWRPRA